MASLNFKLFIHLHIVIVILHFPWHMCIVHWNLLTPDESCGCPGKTLQPQHKILSLELRAASSRKTDLRTWGRTWFLQQSVQLPPVHLWQLHTQSAPDMMSTTLTTTFSIHPVD